MTSRVASALLVLGALLPSSRQDPGVETYVAQAIEEVQPILDAGVAGGHLARRSGPVLIGGLISPKASLSHSFSGKKDESLRFAAAGDEDAEDINLIVRHEDGRRLRADFAPGPRADVTVVLPEDGRYTVEAVLEEAGAESVVALLMLERGGIRLPAARLGESLGRLVDSARRAAPSGSFVALYSNTPSIVAGFGKASIPALVEQGDNAIALFSGRRPTLHGPDGGDIEAGKISVITRTGSATLGFSTPETGQNPEFGLAWLGILMEEEE